MSSGPLRLLLVTDEFELGGTQRHIVNLAQGLDPRRFAVEVAYFRNESPLLDRLAEARIPVTRLDKRARLDGSFVRRFAAHLRAREFAVVHSFALSAEFWGSVAHRLAATGQFMSSVRGRYEWYSWLAWRAKAIASARSVCVVANSVAGAEYAIARGGVPRDKVRVVPNGLQPDAFAGPARDASRAALALAESDLAVLFVGRLVEVKNLPMLLRATAALPEPLRSRTRLLIAGDGPEREACAALGRELRLEASVQWLGERTDVPALQAAADLCVQPSRNEGMSNAIMEAMAAGVPVICTAVGGNPELVRDGESGFLVPDDGVGQLAERMTLLLGDPDRRKAMGAAGRAQAIGRFSLAAMVESMSGIYEQVARGRLERSR